jgi:hypothetical protein
MFKVFFLILVPEFAWDHISVARRGYLYILVTYLLPAIALVTGVEGWRLAKYGQWQSKYEVTKHFTSTAALHFEILHAVLFLTMVLASSILIYMAIESFHGRRSFLQSFTVAAYGYSPVFLFHLLNALPKIHPAIPWAIGAALMIWVLYQAVPRVLRADPVHAFGIYLSVVFIMVLLSALVRVTTAMYLIGQVNLHSSALGRWLQ